MPQRGCKPGSVQAQTPGQRARIDQTIVEVRESDDAPRRIPRSRFSGLLHQTGRI
ncbi:MAG: hypothetical protein GY842_18520 [bacterium]|nr:hypothetical protein [bacterium]